jgi:hypothetical protein
VNSVIICDELLHPERLWSRLEVLSKPSPVPKARGVYAWYFRNLGALVPPVDCHVVGDFHLLYIGISPSAPPSNGKLPSKQSLYYRIRYHMQGNAEGSTLRLSLGCILSEQLGIQLRRVGSGKRFTFATGEQRLSEWLEQNARVAWFSCAEPWITETRLISTFHCRSIWNRTRDVHSTANSRDCAARLKVGPENSRYWPARENQAMSSAAAFPGRHVVLIPLCRTRSTRPATRLIMSIAGHVSRAMLSRYSHVRMEAKRRALDEVAARQRAADAKRQSETDRRQMAAAASPVAVVQ